MSQKIPVVRPQTKPVPKPLQGKTMQPPPKAQNNAPKVVAKKSKPMDPRVKTRTTVRARMPPKPPVRAQNGVPREPAIKFGRAPKALSIRDRLKNKSPWYKSIADPLSGGGTKIPDAIGTATATNQMVYDTSVAINANGVAGFRIASPYPNSQNNGTTVGFNYQITRAASTASALSWSNGTTEDQGFAFPSNQTFVDYAQGVRIVSACIVAMPEMSTLSDQGELCAALTPFDRTPASSSYAFYVQRYDSSTIALNKHKSLRASWYPTAMTDEQGYSREYRDFISPLIQETGDEFPYWELVVVLANAAVSSGNLRVRVVINYEWIPIYNAIDVVSPAPSPIDMEEEEFVCVEMQSDFPVTAQVDDKMISAAPTTASVQSTQQNDTGYGFMAEIMKELGPYIFDFAKMLL